MNTKLLLGLITGFLTTCAGFAYGDNNKSKVPSSFVGLETAYLQPRQTLEASIGQLQTRTITSGGSTGRQTYYGGFSYRNSGKLQFGTNILVFDDVPDQELNGSLTDVTQLSADVNIKYQFIQTDRTAASAQLSLDGIYYSRGHSITQQAYVPSSDKVSFGAATLQFPVSLRLNDSLWVAASLGHSFIPEKSTTIESFGSRSFFESGLIYQISNRLYTYGSIKQIKREHAYALDIRNSQNSSIYTLGGQFSLTPQSAVNFYVTNLFGPFGSAENISFYPNKSQPVFGVSLKYTPSGKGINGQAIRYYEPAFNPKAINNTQISANTFLESDQMSITTFAGSNGANGMALAFSPDPDVLVDFSLENYNLGSTSKFRSTTDEELRYSIGGRWQSLSEEYGHPFTLALGATAGRDVKKPSVGILFADAAFSKKLGKIDLKVSALYGIWAAEKPMGIGLGVSHKILPNFNIDGEIVLTSQQEEIWQFNAKYNFENSPFSLGVFATNAIGRTGVGQLYSTSEPAMGLSLHWKTNLDLF
jgi:hypothetical protein